MTQDAERTEFRYVCPDCRREEAFTTLPSTPPTCCGNLMVRVED
jgi:hypothetical protein